MVAMAGLTTALSGLASGASAVSGLFSSIGSIFSGAMSGVSAAIGKIVAWVKEKWQGVKDWWNDNIQPIFDGIGQAWDDSVAAIQGAIDSIDLGEFFSYDYWFGPDGLFTTILNFIFPWDALFDLSLPAVLTWGYWFGEDGVFTKLADFCLNSFDWDALWSFDIIKYLTWDYWFGEDGVFSAITGFGIDWDDLWSFELPEVLTWDYWFGVEGIFATLVSFIDWDAIFTMPTLDNIFTWDYWFGSEGVFNFTRYINWDNIFDIEIPSWLTVVWWTDLFDDIIDGIGDGFMGFATWLGGIFMGPINTLISGINSLFAGIDFEVTIPNPLGDDWTVGMDLSGWQIPLLAKGGIVTGPTLAMIGEAGPEAVIPLSGSNAGQGLGSTFNITINASGLTDRTNKRDYARRLGNEIQRELSRSLGGSTMRAGR